MANVVKKLSVSYELARKMVDAAVEKARELGVSENVAIVDDGGRLFDGGRTRARTLDPLIKRIGSCAEAWKRGPLWQM
jgi:hypothetical protein